VLGTPSTLQIEKPYQCYDEGPIFWASEQVVETKPKTQYLAKIVALLVLAVVSFAAYTAGAKSVTVAATRFNTSGDGPPACVETCAYTCMAENYYSTVASCPCFMNCDISSCSAEDTALVTAFVNSGCVEPTQDNNEQEYPNYGPATTDAADAMPAMNLEAFHMEFNDSPITGSAPTPLLVNNKECTASDQCESGKCLMWPWNHSIGSCRPRIPNGDPCSINAECTVTFVMLIWESQSENVQLPSAIIVIEKAMYGKIASVSRVDVYSCC